MEKTELINPKDAFKKVNSSMDGLTSNEAKSRLEQYGFNELEEVKKSRWKVFFHTLSGPVNILIEIACLLSLFMRDWADFWVILAMLVINSSIEFFQTIQADNAIEALKASMALKTEVKRDGQWKSIEARELVPGDIINLTNGNIVPADCVMVKGEYVAIDQAALTGESLPVNKKIGSEGFSGSIVKQGDMDAVVTGTGGDTFFGRTASLVQNAGVKSKFQKSIQHIGGFLTIISLFFCAIVMIKGLFLHEPLGDLVQLVLVIIVASIPVAMPAILTITMALGALALSKQKAIVSRLQAIEELAGVDILCSDKTGTLTQNKLSYEEPILFGAKQKEELFLNAALASKRTSTEVIDATVVKYADPVDLDRYTQVKYIPFDPVSKKTEGFIEFEGKQFQVTKGAPQVIIALCDETEKVKKEALDKVNELAKKGFRALGVAKTDSKGKYKLSGILSLFDPPREDSADVIRSAKNYGLKVKMVTGDDIAIGIETSRQLGLGQNMKLANEIFSKDDDMQALPRSVQRKIVTADGFARVFPEHKYGIVNAYQDIGRTVAMTGDGVNDAPALKQANVGIAVQGATDAARASADLVLTAPGLSVIANAIESARKIFSIMVSYLNYRIVMTLNVLLFISLAILFIPLPAVANGTPMTAFMIVIVALLDDIPMMAIAYDNAKADPLPIKWDVKPIFLIAIIMGLVATVQNFVLMGWLMHPIFLENFSHMFLSAIPVAGVPAAHYLPFYHQLQTAFFLQIAVAGHLILFISRHRMKWFWMRPLPSGILFWAIVLTQIFAMFMCVYGWFGIPKISWDLVIFIWLYDIAWMFIFNIARIQVEKLFLSDAERVKYRNFRQLEKAGKVEVSMS